MLSRWLRWLVVAPVLLFVFGALMLSCGGSSSTSVIATPSPGFSLTQLVIANGAPPSPTFTPSATATATPTPKVKPTPKPTKSTTPTLTPRPSASPTYVPTTAPSGIPTPVAFNVIGTLSTKTRTKYTDLTASTSTLWTSSNASVLLAPPPGLDGGVYTTGTAGCVCILASNSGVSSQFVVVGVGVPFDSCPECTLEPTPTPTATSSPAPGATPAASTVAPGSRSAGVLMWTFDPGAELSGRIVAGADGSIYFITRDGVLHGLNSAGKEIMRQNAAGASPAVLPDGTVVAMSSSSELAAIAPYGTTAWNLEIGASAGPLAVTDRAIYASAGGDLVSVSAAGVLNWRVGVGTVTTAATTPDGIVVGTSRGAVTAIASDGAVIWTFEPDGGFSGSVAYADDVVYAGSASGGVYAIDSRTGNALWHVNSAQAVTTGPAVAPSGTIFAGSDAVYGVTSDGQLRWKDSTLKPGDAGIFVLGYDSVFDAAAGDIGAVLLGDGSYLWTSRSFGKITTAATSPSGMLYVGTSTGRIFAVR
jgi:outer membrane protein assembly factor BamB